jgi:hypothetical protein
LSRRELEFRDYSKNIFRIYGKTKTISR